MTRVWSRAPAVDDPWVLGVVRAERIGRNRPGTTRPRFRESFASADEAARLRPLRGRLLSEGKRLAQQITQFVLEIQEFIDTPLVLLHNILKLYRHLFLLCLSGAAVRRPAARLRGVEAGGDRDEVSGQGQPLAGPLTDAGCANSVGI